MFWLLRLFRLLKLVRYGDAAKRLENAFRMVRYDPGAPLHDRYLMDEDFLSAEDEALLEDVTLTINAFFGWDFNSCEALRKEGHWRPIDFANPCPDSQVTSLHYHFPWLVLAKVRWSLFCGEALSMADAADWQAAAPDSQVENLYGPTEVTQVCAGHRFPRPLQILEPDRGTWAPIGEVFSHLSHRVVDETGNDVAPGEEGELWIAGPQVFDGYLKRPEENERAFASDDAGSSTSRFYRTGDIVRSDRRGRLRFVGRRDSQVKVTSNSIGEPHRKPASRLNWKEAIGDSVMPISISG